MLEMLTGHGSVYEKICIFLEDITFFMNENSLIYSNLYELKNKIHEALNMKEDEIIFKRSKVQEFYKLNLSPESFKKNFNKIAFDSKSKIICCDDHRSVEGIV